MTTGIAIGKHYDGEITDVCAHVLSVLLFRRTSLAGDLPEVQQNGVLRHLGVPYANFVTGAGDGLDVELVQRFAKQLGVQYEYVPTTWADFIGDLTGQRPPGPGVQGKDGDKAPVRGDIAAHGITVIPWRQQVLKFSLPTMPTQVWVLARADSSAKPIIPAKNRGQGHCRGQGPAPEQKNPGYPKYLPGPKSLRPGRHRGQTRFFLR